MAQALRIGQLAQATGVSAKTIRYYEQVGVLPAPSRSGAGYRQYTPQGVHRLRFIRRARGLGLPLRQQLLNPRSGNHTGGCRCLEVEDDAARDGRRSWSAMRSGG
jgi:DNA-binding transcriptional MerR regulator